jgi:hypothetical protein
MTHSRLFAIIAIVGALLAVFVVGSGLAQTPGTGSEPDVPMYDPEPQGSADSSQPVGSAPDEAQLTQAQRESSAPIESDGAVASPSDAPAAPEDLPEGLEDIEAITAITDFRVTGTALKPRGDDVSYVPTAGGGCFYASAGNSFRAFNTGLYLPQGSNVLAMRMYYNDTSTSNSRAWFTVYDLYGDIVQEWSVDSVGDIGNGFNDTGLISHTINYLGYSYAINWRPHELGLDTQLCGFRIFYEPPPTWFGAFLPATQKNYSVP